MSFFFSPEKRFKKREGEPHYDWVVTICAIDLNYEIAQKKLLLKHYVCIFMCVCLSVHVPPVRRCLHWPREGVRSPETRATRVAGGCETSNVAAENQKTWVLSESTKHF